MSETEKRKIANEILEAVKQAETDFFMHRAGYYEPRIQAVLSGMKKFELQLN